MIEKLAVELDVIPLLLEVLKGCDSDKGSGTTQVNALRVARKNAAIAIAKLAANPQVGRVGAGLLRVSSS